MPEIRKATEALGISIHDHLVIGRKGMQASGVWGCCERNVWLGPCKPGFQWLLAVISGSSRSRHPIIRMRELVRSLADCRRKNA